MCDHDINCSAPSVYLNGNRKFFTSISAGADARFARSRPTVDKWIVLRLHIFVDSGLINDAAIIEQFIVTTY